MGSFKLCAPKTYYNRRSQGTSSDLDLCDPSPRTLELTQWTGTIYELLPGQNFRANIGPPIPFWNQLVPGARYGLLWPGAAFILWNWSTRPKKFGQELGADSSNPVSFSLEGPCASLTVIEETQVFPPPPSPPLVKRSDRM